jgi:hypothetical protein
MTSRSTRRETVSKITRPCPIHREGRRDARHVLACCGNLFHLAKAKGIECRDAVGLSPKAHHAGPSKRRVLDLE